MEYILLAAELLALLLFVIYLWARSSKKKPDATDGALFDQAAQNHTVEEPNSDGPDFEDKSHFFAQELTQNQNILEDISTTIKFDIVNAYRHKAALAHIQSLIKNLAEDELQDISSSSLLKGKRKKQVQQYGNSLLGLKKLNDEIMEELSSPPTEKGGVKKKQGEQKIDYKKLFNTYKKYTSSLQRKLNLLLA